MLNSQKCDCCYNLAVSTFALLSKFLFSFRTVFTTIYSSALHQNTYSNLCEDKLFALIYKCFIKEFLLFTKVELHSLYRSQHLPMYISTSLCKHIFKGILHFCCLILIMSLVHLSHPSMNKLNTTVKGQLLIYSFHN